MLILRDRLERGDVRVPFRVIQRASGRVVIVEAPATAEPQLRETSGVQAVLRVGEGADVGISRCLTDAELTFVEAFKQRGEGLGRASDGLAWDAETYEAPDLPHNPD